MWFLLLLVLYLGVGLAGRGSRRAASWWVTGLTVVVVFGQGARAHLL